MAEILKRFTALDFILLGLNELFLIFVPILCGITPSSELGMAGLLVGIVFGGAAIFIGDPFSIQNIISEGAWIPLICWMAGLGIGKFVSWFRS